MLDSKCTQYDGVIRACTPNTYLHSVSPHGSSSYNFRHPPLHKLEILDGNYKIIESVFVDKFKRPEIWRQNLVWTFLNCGCEWCVSVVRAGHLVILPVKNVIQTKYKNTVPHTLCSNIGGAMQAIYQDEHIVLRRGSISCLVQLHTRWFMVSFQLVHPFVMTSLPHHYSVWQQVIRSEPVRAAQHQLLCESHSHTCPPCHTAAPKASWQGAGRSSSC